MAESKIELGDVERLDVKPGDKLLVSLPHYYDDTTAEMIENTFKEFFPDTEIIVKHADIDVQVISGDSGSTD